MAAEHDVCVLSEFNTKTFSLNLYGQEVPVPVVSSMEEASRRTKERLMLIWKQCYSGFALVRASFRKKMSDEVIRKRPSKLAKNAKNAGILTELHNRWSRFALTSGQAILFEESGNLPAKTSMIRAWMKHRLPWPLLRQLEDDPHSVTYVKLYRMDGWKRGILGIATMRLIMPFDGCHCFLRSTGELVKVIRVDFLFPSFMVTFHVVGQEKKKLRVEVAEHFTCVYNACAVQVDTSTVTGAANDRKRRVLLSLRGKAKVTIALETIDELDDETFLKYYAPLQTDSLYSTSHLKRRRRGQMRKNNAPPLCC
jgi:hypothetical protein